VRGGLGAAIAQAVAETCPVPIRFIGIRDTYLESASVEELMVQNHLTAADIAEAAHEAVVAKAAARGAAGRK
jgi:transketolase